MRRGVIYTLGVCIYISRSIGTIRTHSILSHLIYREKKKQEREREKPLVVGHILLNMSWTAKETDRVIRSIIRWVAGWYYRNCISILYNKYIYLLLHVYLFILIMSTHLNCWGTFQVSVGCCCCPLDDHTSGIKLMGGHHHYIIYNYIKV